MELINCKKCGKLILKNNTSYLCESCIKEQKVYLQAIKEYISKHPNSTIFDVSKETGIELSLIYDFLNQDLIDYKK